MTHAQRHSAPAIALAGAVLFGSLSQDGTRAAAATPPTYDPSHGLILRGTIVTMDDRHTIIPNGSVLVRNDRIVAVWQGSRPPVGTVVGDATHLDLGPNSLIFPGMINLHNHPTFITPLWLAPTSHLQPDLGRPLGTEPYANRYQWNRMFGAASPELQRLVAAPEIALNSSEALNLSTEVVKYAEIRSLLGGETSLQGAPSQPTTDDLLARNVDSANFGRAKDKIERLPDFDVFRDGRVESDECDASWRRGCVAGALVRGGQGRRPPTRRSVLVARRIRRAEGRWTAHR